MKNCPKCDSKDVKEKDVFAKRSLEGQQNKMIENEDMKYQCGSCGNEWPVELNESNDQ